MSLIIISRSSANCKSRYLQPTSIDYTAKIHGRFALCELTQVYNVTVPGKSEGIYKFPVDYNSAFCDLIIATPREKIQGVVQEKSQAKETYETAKRQGRQAFLTEESETDRDIYKLSMANILKGDEITIRYTYITELESTGISNTFYIPSFISPRYNGECIKADKHNITCKVEIADKLAKVKCLASNVQCYNTESAFVIEYKSEKVMETDIEITIESTFTPSAYKFNCNGYDMRMMQFMPKSEECDIANNDEICFILDCSGSMDGQRIDHSKKAIIRCLEMMKRSAANSNRTFKFNIIKFGSNHTMFNPTKMISNTDINIKAAIKYCQGIQANMGGTEMVHALKACLDICNTALLITDGDTSNNASLHKLCKDFSCLSILGIGSGINRANIIDMAKNGGGMTRFSQNDSDISANIESLFKDITLQRIRKYKIDWDGCTKSLITTKSILFNQPNAIYSILYQPSSQEIFTVEALKIKLEITPLDIPIDAKYNDVHIVRRMIPIDAKYLGALIAKRIIQDNEIDSTFTKEDIVDLAVKFNIITPYTSMVAVSDTVAVENKTDKIIEGDEVVGDDESTDSDDDLITRGGNNRSFGSNFRSNNRGFTGNFLMSLLYNDCSLTRGANFSDDEQEEDEDMGCDLFGGSIVAGAGELGFSPPRTRSAASKHPSVFGFNTIGTSTRFGGSAQSEPLSLIGGISNLDAGSGTPNRFVAHPAPASGSFPTTAQIDSIRSIKSGQVTVHETFGNAGYLCKAESLDLDKPSTPRYFKAASKDIPAVSKSNSNSNPFGFFGKMFGSSATAPATAPATATAKALLMSSNERSLLFQQTYSAMSKTIPVFLDMFFDNKSGLVLVTIKSVPQFSSLPNEISNNIVELTMFVLYFLYRTKKSLFAKYYAIASTNEQVAKLFDDIALL